MTELQQAVKILTHEVNAIIDAGAEMRGLVQSWCGNSAESDAWDEAVERWETARVGWLEDAE